MSYNKHSSVDRTCLGLRQHACGLAKGYSAFVCVHVLFNTSDKITSLHTQAERSDMQEDDCCLLVVGRFVPG